MIDPDSRLTQLGLLPVCAEERYHLFESRGYGGECRDAAARAGRAWAAETFGVAGPAVRGALGRAGRARPYIAVSLGVGENPAKRLPDPFEERTAGPAGRDRGCRSCIDRGAGGEEAERVARAAERSGVAAHALGRILRGLRRASSPAPASTSATIPPASTWPPPAASR